MAIWSFIITTKLKTEIVNIVSRADILYGTFVYVAQYFYKLTII